MNYAQSHHASIGYSGRGARWVGMAVVVGLHAAVVMALLAYQPVREALGMKPLMVEFITPPAPPTPEQPKETPKPPEVKVVTKVVEPPRQKTVVTTQSGTPSQMTAPPPPVEPKPAPPVDAAPAPAPPAPPAPASQPRIVSGVEYMRAPQPVYPPLARRANEQGKVVFKVVIDPAGHAEKVDIFKSSGSARLDEAGRVAVLQALFKPYMENGQAVTAQVNIPITFSLSD